MVNLVGGLYPGLYDWVTVDVPVPVVPPGACLTSEVVVQDAVTSEVEVSTEVLVDACVRVQYFLTQKETTVLVMACEIDVRGQVIYETLECRDFVTSEVSVRQMDMVPPLSPPVMCAEVEVWYLTSAIECMTTPGGVVAEVEAKVAVEADISFCCVEMPWPE